MNILLIDISINEYSIKYIPSCISNTHHQKIINENYFIKYKCHQTSFPDISPTSIPC